jgi:hypothetical protein
MFCFLIPAPSAPTVKLFICWRLSGYWANHWVKLLNQHHNEEVAPLPSVDQDHSAEVSPLLSVDQDETLS